MKKLSLIAAILVAGCNSSVSSSPGSDVGATASNGVYSIQGSTELRRKAPEPYDKAKEAKKEKHKAKRNSKLTKQSVSEFVSVVLEDSDISSMKVEETTVGWVEEHFEKESFEYTPDSTAFYVVATGDLTWSLFSGRGPDGERVKDKGKRVEMAISSEDGSIIVARLYRE